MSSVSGPLTDGSTSPTAAGAGSAPIAPEAVLQFLVKHPEFLESHPEVLAAIRVPHAAGGRTVSLIERQIELIRDKNKALEQRIVELMRHAADNERIAHKGHEFTQRLLQIEAASELPAAVEEGIKDLFSVPLTALRLWQVNPAYQHSAFAEPVPSDVQTFTNSLTAPYCGPNSDFAAAQWLGERGASARSLGLIPLGLQSGSSFGLLVLGSTDPQRFTPDMGTDFLAEMGRHVSAALSRLTH